MCDKCRGLDLLLEKALQNAELQAGVKAAEEEALAGKKPKRGVAGMLALLLMSRAVSLMEEEGVSAEGMFSAFMNFAGEKLVKSGIAQLVPITPGLSQEEVAEAVSTASEVKRMEMGLTKSKEKERFH